MNTTTLIYVLLIAAALTAVERRWGIPFLQSAGRLLAGWSLLQFSRQFAQPRIYLFAGLGLCWIVLGLRGLLQDRAARRRADDEAGRNGHASN